VLRECCGWLPCVDGVVAGGADDEVLASRFGHELSPRWLRLPRPGEFCERADLVDLVVIQLIEHHRNIRPARQLPIHPDITQPPSHRTIRHPTFSVPHQVSIPGPHPQDLTQQG